MFKGRRVKVIARLFFTLLWLLRCQGGLILFAALDESFLCHCFPGPVHCGYFYSSDFDNAYGQVIWFP